MRDLATWSSEEHSGVVVLLLSLADWEASVLRQAALEVAGEWVDPDDAGPVARRHAGVPADLDSKSLPWRTITAWIRWSTARKAS